MIDALIRCLAMRTIMIYHWTYNVYLTYISSLFSSRFAFFYAFSFIIKPFLVSIFCLFLGIHFFIFRIHFLISTSYFYFWVFYVIFTVTLIIFLIARAFYLFSFWSDERNSKWFFFIFLIDIMFFRNFVAAWKSVFSVIMWFVFLFIILLTIKVSILLLLNMIHKICLNLWILKGRKLLSWNIACWENTIHVNSKIVFLKIMIMKIVVFLLLETMQIILLEFVFIFSRFFS